MWYWNRDNFEGLKALFAILCKDARFSDLATYCHLREIGHRKQAFAALDRFIGHALKRPLQERSEMIDFILCLAAQAWKVHHFISNPLKTKFLLPGLAEWLRSEPDSSVALRWEGWINYNSEALRRSLELNPADDFVRSLLIDRENLSVVEFAVHHIDDSVLIVNLQIVEAHLAEAEQLLLTSPQPSRFAHLSRELSYLKRLIDDWKQFMASGEKSFPSWRKNS